MENTNGQVTQVTRECDLIKLLEVILLTAIIKYLLGWQTRQYAIDPYPVC